MKVDSLAKAIDEKLFLSGDNGAASAAASKSNPENDTGEDNEAVNITDANKGGRRNRKKNRK